MDSNESPPTTQHADVGEGVLGQPPAPPAGLVLLATSALGPISVLALISIVALGCLCLLTISGAPSGVWDWDQRGDRRLPVEGHKERSRSNPPSAPVDAIEQQRRHGRSVDIVPQSPLLSASHIGPRDSGANDTLCADLTVPPQCECTLLIPVVASQSGSLPVMTVTGNKLFDLKVPRDFKADVRSHAGIGESSLHHGQREVWLLSSGGEVIARCMASARSPNDVGEYRIHDKHDTYFASVYRASGQYVLNSPSISSKCFFFGQCSQMALNVVKAGGQLLAATEVVFMDFAPGVDLIRLRVTSGGDVGLVLCALACLQDLQAIDPLN